MAQNKNKKIGAYGLAIIATILFGTNAVALKIASDSVDPMTYVTFRMLGAGLILLLFLKNLSFLRDKRVLLHLFLSGGFMLGAMLLYAPGVAASGALKASVLALTIPVLVYLFSVFILHEPYIKRVMLGGVVAMAGSMLLIGLPIVFGNPLLLGDILLLGAFSLLAAAIIHAKYLFRWLTPNQIVSCRFFIAGIGLAIYMLAFHGPAILFEAEPIGWLMVAYGVIVTAVIGNTIYYRALKHIRAEQLAPIFYLDPLTGTLLASIFLGERLEITALIGAVVIIVGVLVSYPHHLRLFYHYHIPRPRGSVSFLRRFINRKLHSSI